MHQMIHLLFFIGTCKYIVATLHNDMVYCDWVLKIRYSMGIGKGAMNEKGTEHLQIFLCIPFQKIHLMSFIGTLCQHYIMIWFTTTGS